MLSALVKPRSSATAQKQRIALNNADVYRLYSSLVLSTVSAKKASNIRGADEAF